MRLLKLVPEDTNINFLKWRMPFYVVSILLIIGSWALVFTNGLNYGVDFAGGQEVRLTFEGREEAPIPELREEFEQLGYGTPQIQRLGEDNQVSIRIQLPEGAEDQPGSTKCE
jgi:preprotein translocase subunit SecF